MLEDRLSDCHAVRAFGGLCAGEVHVLCRMALHGPVRDVKNHRGEIFWSYYHEVSR